MTRGPTVARGQKTADDTINELIVRRSREEWSEDLWAASERRHAAMLRKAARAEWVRFHEQMCRLHTGLAQEHEEKAARLRSLAELGEPA